MSRAVASVWAPIAAHGLVRPHLDVPGDIDLICVGGATIGGSGKTRVAIACAAWLASRGARVVLVGHAYRGSIGSPRFVTENDDDRIDHVGDEAIVCRRALGTFPHARVVVGPTRQASIEHILRAKEPRPHVIILDGPLRIRDRESLRLLAVDAQEPWGSGHVPPRGDLRANRDALVACADFVVPVDALPQSVRWDGGDRDRTEPIESLQNARIGLFTAIARPRRLIDALERKGIRPQQIVSISDHGPLDGQARARLQKISSSVDAWVATEKCALHLIANPPIFTRPTRLGVLEGACSLDAVLQHRLTQLLFGTNPSSGVEVRITPT